MNDDLINVCPKCETLYADNSTFCPACGYSFINKMAGTGPFSFAYEKGAHAYIPSGKSVSGSNLKLFLVGLVIALVMGGLLYIAQVLVALLAVVVSSFSGLLAIIVAFIGYAVVASLAAVVLSKVIGDMAIRQKNRNVKAVTRISAFGGIICFLSYLFIVILVKKAEAFDSFIDYVITIGFAAIIIGFASYGNKDEINRPFCEDCDEYMQSLKVERIPIKYEKRIMDLASERRFDEIIAKEIDNNQKNYCAVSIWFCNSCKAYGYFSITTYQERYKKNNKADIESRLIFSAAISEDELGKLLSGPA